MDLQPHDRNPHKAVITYHSAEEYAVVRPPWSLIDIGHELLEKVGIMEPRHFPLEQTVGYVALERWERQLRGLSALYDRRPDIPDIQATTHLRLARAIHNHLDSVHKKGFDTI